MNIKIFAVSDEEWWAGDTAEATMNAFAMNCGYSIEEVSQIRDEGYPVELTDEELQTNLIGIEVWDTPEHEAEGRIPRIERVPFRQELDRMIAAGTEFPCHFAGMEF